MKTDYDYYLLGCRYMEVPPLSRWRFAVSYAKYRQMVKWEMDEWRSLAAKDQPRIVARWNRLRRLATLVHQGQELAARSLRFDGDDEPGATGAGDREPRTPRAPVLCGCGARSLPYPDPNAFVERQL